MTPQFDTSSNISDYQTSSIESLRAPRTVTWYAKSGFIAVLTNHEIIGVLNQVLLQLTSVSFGSSAAPSKLIRSGSAIGGKAAARSAAYYELQQAANGQKRSFNRCHKPTWSERGFFYRSSQ